MQRSYPLRWLALAIALLGGTQCLDSISDDCTKTLTCENDEQPELGKDDCIWRFPGGRVWEDGPRYDLATRRWRWPDGTETETQTFQCYLTAAEADAGASTDAGAASFDCRINGPCDVPLVCDDATGACVECLVDAECAGNLPVGDAGAATVCDSARHECVQCLDNEHCSGDTPVCRVDATNSARNRCVECQTSRDCSGATPICDEATNECTASCTTTADCSGDKPVCNTTRNICVECLDNSTCTTADPVCDTATNQCVECLDDTRCAGAGEVCNLDSHRCVQCNADVQCQNGPNAATTPYCDTETNLCVTCLNDQQCDASESSRCNVVTHQCAGCNSDSQCEAGTRCSGGVCVQCTEDSHCNPIAPVCGPGGRCVECEDSSQCLDVDSAHCETVATDNTRFTCVRCKGNADCGAAKSLPDFCNTVSGVCVACLTAADCGSPSASRCQNGNCIVCVDDADCELYIDDNTPACKPNAGCVECVSNAHCADTPETPVCKTAEGNGPTQGGGPAAINTCVECTTNADCQTNAGASRCENNQCVPCVADADCALVDSNGSGAGGEPRNVCDEGTCVECTGLRREACNGGTNVCDSLARECAPFAAGSADLCEPCVSDAHCDGDARCVEQTFGTTVIGYFCVPTPVGTPASCASRRPFFQSAQLPTIDVRQSVPTVCVLQETTCPGLNAQTSDCEQDSDCGAEGVADGLCREFENVDLCTTPCGSDVDCIGDCALGGFCDL